MMRQVFGASRVFSNLCRLSRGKSSYVGSSVTLRKTNNVLRKYSTAVSSASAVSAPVDLSKEDQIAERAKKYETVHQTYFWSYAAFPEGRWNLPFYVYDFKPDDYNEESGSSIVAVHSVPGSCSDFHELGLEMMDRGVRFITFDFIGHGMSSFNFTKRALVTRFSHEAYFRDIIFKVILDHLKIYDADVLLSQGTGCWVAYHNLSHPLNRFKTAMFLNSAGKRRHKGMEPYHLNKFVSYLAQIFIYRVLYYLPMYTRFFQLYVKLMGYRLKPHQATQTSIRNALKTLFSTNLYEIQECVEGVAAKNIPFVMASAKDDNIHNWDVAKEISDMLGVTDKQTILSGPNYDSSFADDAYLSTKKDFKRFVLYENGGEQLQKTQMNDVIKYLDQLLSLTEESKIKDNIK